ncbi:ParB/RepB/Spo0J family partition protein [Streptomyces spororaveus]|uniref:ParB/RepB/Spo0J family partition protein n=1 Tax=Streptomyces spororaveus TaxID=284039 RepID=UPI0020799AF2|nr:ParB/RepB/Spo0J family partition protein [Streptomyces spororaveus]MCM9082387.1 ParB/RepB/Spo0J family partition protein [Streptomyces spororaveus]
MEDLELKLQECPVETVSIALLRLGASPRLDGEDDAHVRLLAASTAELPPILVHAATMKVMDGAHRVRAAILRGQRDIRARCYRGDAEEGFALAVSLNARHGLPLTAADRTAAAVRIMTCRPQWSNRRVARLAGLSPSTVASLRNRSTDLNDQSNTRVGSDGRARPVSGAAGRLQARELLLSRPELSLRQVARAVGIAPSTVRDVRDRLASGQDPLPPRQRGNPRYAKGATSTPAAPAKTPAPVPAAAPVPEAVAGSAPLPTGGAVPRPRVPDRDVLLRRLRSDPSLRFNETGRSLLRWLGQHPHDSAELGQVVRSVPPHWATAVAELIRVNVEAWAECAEALEQQAGEPFGGGGESRCAS